MERTTDPQKPTGSGRVSPASAHRQDHTMDTSVPTISSRPPIRPSNYARISKRCREKARNALVRQQSLTSNSKLASHVLTEERLFELLIVKIRQREENETAATNIRHHLEGDNAQLVSENQQLRQQMESYDQQLKKMTVDSKVRQSRMDSWKARLQKFKNVVNELGGDYDALRLEAEKLKGMTKSLEKEKCDLVETIDRIKIQIARAEATIDGQGSKILADDREISALRQALESANERLEDARAELVEEKRRAASLESYILNYARDQARQLVSIRVDQSKLHEKFTSAVAIAAEESTAARNTILSEMRALSEAQQSSVRTLGEKCSSERLEVQKFSNTAHEIVSR